MRAYFAAGAFLLVFRAGLLFKVREILCYNDENLRYRVGSIYA
jgi:hypothetical protein